MAVSDAPYPPGPPGRDEVERRFAAAERLFTRPLAWGPRQTWPAFAPPPPDPEGLPPLPPAELGFGGISGDPDLDRRTGRVEAAQARALMARAGLPPQGLRLLEWGCGGGRLLRRLWPEARDRGWQLTGVDLDARAIAWLQSFWPVELRLATVGQAPHLPFRDAAFDVALAVGVFTHVRDLADAWVLELARTVRPGGLVIATVQAETAWAWLRAHRAEPWVARSHPPGLFAASEPPAEELAVGDGLDPQVFVRLDHVLARWRRFFPQVEAHPPVAGGIQDWIVAHVV